MSDIFLFIVSLRVLGTDYGSSWVRELTWALLLGGELLAAAALAATSRSESLGSSSVYSKVCHTRITRLEASGLGFQTLRMMGIGESGGRAKSTVTSNGHIAAGGSLRPERSLRPEVQVQVLAQVHEQEHAHVQVQAQGQAQEQVQEEQGGHEGRPGERGPCVWRPSRSLYASGVR